MVESSRFFRGLYVPIITPFDERGELALDALKGLAERLLEDGAAGVRRQSRSRRRPPPAPARLLLAQSGRVTTSSPTCTCRE
jgi:hypothetical protein